MSPEGGGDPEKASVWMLSEIRSSLGAIQAGIAFMRDEQGAIRSRLHDLSNQIQPLMGIPEQMREMKRDHESLKLRLDKLDERANMGRGAIWATGIFGAFFGTIVGIAISLTKLFR